MRPSPHRAGGIVENFGSDGTQQEAPERTVAVSRHDDQLGAEIARAADDLKGRIANYHLAGERHVGTSDLQIFFELELSLLQPFLAQVLHDRVCRGVERVEEPHWRGHHVKQSEFAMEMTRQRFGVLNGATAAGRKCHRSENPGQPSHDRTSWPASRRTGRLVRLYSTAIADKCIRKFNPRPAHFGVGSSGSSIGAPRYFGEDRDHGSQLGLSAGSVGLMAAGRLAGGSARTGRPRLRSFRGSGPW